MARAVACFSLLIAAMVDVTQACDAAGLQKCTSDFLLANQKSAAGDAAANKAASCAAVETYETCFASNSDGCPAQMADSLKSQIDTAKAQLNCAAIPSDNSVSKSGEKEPENSKVVTVACDATGLQQCVNAFSTGVAGATDKATKCKVLSTYDNCLAEKTVGCSDAQKNAFVAPVESVKSSLSCDEEDLTSNAPMVRPCAFSVFALSAMLAFVSMW